MLRQAKIFAENLNTILDEMEMAEGIQERATILAKMVQIPKEKARVLLLGNMMPDENILQRLSEELDLTPDDFLGQSD